MTLPTRPGPLHLARLFVKGASVYRIAMLHDVPLGEVEDAVRKRLVQLERRDLKRRAVR